MEKKNNMKPCCTGVSLLQNHKKRECREWGEENIYAS
jgi:hypothetical protein